MLRNDAWRNQQLVILDFGANMVWNSSLLACLLCQFLACWSMAQGHRIVGGGTPVDDIEITTSHEIFAQEGINTLSGQGLLPSQAAASRFLAQATLGADYELIDSVARVGISTWLDAQLALPTNFSMEAQFDSYVAAAQDSILLQGGDTTNLSTIIKYWYMSWWKHVMDEPDLVRARVAFALSEHFVVSENSNIFNRPRGLASFYDVLLNNALGNYRDLLHEVTMHPAMGMYLTYVNNPKTDTIANTYPDENYARELMQLFTIGLYELNPDGTEKLDMHGQPIPTYDNYFIGEFAKIFTGFGWANAPAFRSGPRVFNEPMQMWDEWHEPGPKYLLNGDTIPNRQPVDGLADVSDALDNLFNHPNAGPFLARKLIQRLVKSNPSPAYIGRITTRFNDNGAGVRGDLAAVVRAILLDPEARSCQAQADEYAGMLREPIVRYTQICRAFNAKVLDGIYRNSMEALQTRTLQKVLAAPSVFNFFIPDYQPQGPLQMAGLFAPEFQITNSQSAIGYGNMLNFWAMDVDQLMQFVEFYSDELATANQRAMLDLTDEINLATAGEIDQLIERYNLILCHGNMSDYTRSILSNLLHRIPGDQIEIIVRMGIFTVMLSPDYLIFR